MMNYRIKNFFKRESESNQAETYMKEKHKMARNMGKVL